MSWRLRVFLRDVCAAVLGGCFRGMCLSSALLSWVFFWGGFGRCLRGCLSVGGDLGDDFLDGVLRGCLRVCTLRWDVLHMYRVSLGRCLRLSLDYGVRREVCEGGVLSVVMMLGDVFDDVFVDSFGKCELRLRFLLTYFSVLLHAGLWPLSFFSRAACE